VSAARGPVRGALFAAALLAGCAQLPQQPLVAHPGSPRAAATAAPVVPHSPGAIYADGARGLALFEDRRPRHAGDILTVVITERSDASKQAGTSASRNGKLTADFGVTPKLLGGLLRGQDAALSADNGMTAKGGASATNSFDGVITVTVVEVLPNGNLAVSGEKQMLINQGTEFIRFSGVVNPSTVLANNTVPSTQVADARIEYSSTGFLREAQEPGWLQRFFFNVLPF